jgi:hypothetical protein
MRGRHTAIVLGNLAVILMIMISASSLFAQTPMAIPYMTSVIAGTPGANSASNPFTVGQPCPSGGGKTATDIYGDGCLATEAVLDTSQTGYAQIVFDSIGNAYFVDYDPNGNFSLVHKVDAVTGIMTAFAGGLSATADFGTTPCDSYTNGTHTGSDPAVNSLAYANKTAGDGCPAVDPVTFAPYTYFKGIRDIAIDANYLYIADSSNSRVRKVSLSNTTAQPYAYYPHECEPVAGFGGSGWSQDGSLNTVAVKNIYSVAVDTAGNVFFGDQSGNSIRRATPTTYSLVGGVWTPTVGSVVTILNCVSSGSTCVAPASGAGCPTGSPAGASKNQKTYTVTGMAFDFSSNLYAAVTHCYSVYRIANNGSNPIDGSTALTTLMGVGMTGSYGGSWMPAYSGGAQSSTRAVASAGNGNLYIINSQSAWFYDASDTANGATNGWIHQFWNNSSAAGVGCSIIGTAAGTPTYYGCPAQVSEFQKGKGNTDAYGNLYVVDNVNNVVLKAATGLDFEGTAPQVQTTGALTQTALIHGAGINDSNVSTSSPFSVAGLLSYPAGGPFTSDCSTYGSSTDGATDCTYSVTYTPTALGVQAGTLSTNGTNLPLNGYAIFGGPPVIVSCMSIGKTYGQPDPPFAFITSPTVRSWTVAPVCAVTAEAGAGSYPISVMNCASVAAPGFGPFSCVAAGTLTVNPATPTLAISCPDVPYDGNPHSCTGSATGVTGAAVAGTWSFNPASETAAGSYPVTGTFTSSDPNYVSGGTATGTIIIVAPPPPVFVTPTVVPYMTSLFAGTPGGNSASSPFTVGQPCPSGGGKTATDVYGDGCLATEADLYTPYQVVFDSSGNAYIADYDPAGFSFVRKVDAVTGVITMFAGGLSGQVTGGPCASYTDGQGHTGPDTLITGITNYSQTGGDGCPATDPVTGASYSYFKGIRDLAIDANWLYVDDSSNSRLRRVSLSSSPAMYHWYIHEIEPIAGIGTSGWSQDGSPANLTQIKNPYSVVVDSQGNIFLGDQSGNAVRRITPTTYTVNSNGVATAANIGTVLTVVNCATSGSTCVVPPVLGAVCPSGSPAGASENLATSNVTGMAFDTSGNLYIAAQHCYSVYEIAANASGVVDGTTQMTTLMGDGTSGTYTGGTWMQAFTGGAQSSIRSVTTAGGNNLYVLNGTSAWFYNASDTANGATGGWLYQFWNSASPVGTGCAGSVGTTTYFGCPAPYSEYAGGSTGGKGSVDAYGNLYVADGGDAVVLKAATGLDFIGTAPQVQVTEGSSLTNTVFSHGTGISDSDVSTSSPFSLAPLLSFSSGTADCNTNGSGTDGATDCTYSLTYTPTAIGLQTGSLNANGTNLPLDGYGNSVVLPVTVSCMSYVKTYGQPDPAFGFNTSVTVRSWTVAPVCAVTAEAGAGSYPITVTNCASVAAPGFGTVSCVAGTLTVNPAAPTLALSCVEVPYDGNPHSCTGSATGVTGAAVAGTWSYNPASETAAGSYPITGTFTSSDPNYVSGLTVSGTLTIDAPPPPAYPSRAIPYMTSIYAGTPGGNSASNPYAVGQACPSGRVATDIYGDGCLATEAVLDASTTGFSQIVFDSSGNAYLVDYDLASFSFVRKVDAVTGVITMFAGGLSSSVAAPGPCASYSDGQGHTGQDPLVAAITDNSVNAGDGCPAEDPVTGASYSYFKGIRDLAIDANWLYISDSSSSRIRRVSLSSSPAPYHWYVHEIEPIAGHGTSGFTVDGSPANLAQIKNPYSIALDSAGNIFFGDQSGNMVRRVTPTTYAVNSSGVATATIGNLLTVVNCASSGSTCVVPPNGGQTCPGTNPTGVSKNLVVYAVTGMTFDAFGDLYIAASRCYSVYKIAPNASGMVDGTTQMTTLIGNGVTGTYTGGTWMQAFSGGAQSSMRSVTSAGGNNLYVFNGTSAWFYDADDNANGASQGWLRQIWNSSLSAGTGCTDMIGTTTPTYYGCPAPVSEFQAGKGNTDQYGNLYVVDNVNNVVLKASTGLDFSGTGPQVQVTEGSSLTNTVFLHGTGISDSDVTTFSPFGLAGLLSYPAGGPDTADCNTNGSGTDGATDCTYWLTYTPTAVGLQNGTLNANGTILPLDGYGASDLVQPVTPTIMVYGVNPLVYDGTAHALACAAYPPSDMPQVTGPITGACSVTPASITNAGTYTVLASFISADQRFTNAGPNLPVFVTMIPAQPVWGGGCPSATYDGQPHACNFSAIGVTGEVIPGTWNYGGGAVTVGSWGIRGIFTSADPNYLGGNAEGVITILPANSVLAINCPNLTYDGNPHSCTGSATGVSGASVAGSFSCVPASEINAGTYPVTCTFTSSDTNYTNGQASGVMTITLGLVSQNPQWNCPSPVTYDANPHGCTPVSGTCFGTPSSGTVTNVPGGTVGLSCSGDTDHSVWNGTSPVITITKAAGTIACQASLQYAFPAPVVQPCAVMAGTTPIVGAPITYKIVVGGTITGGGSAITLSAPLMTTAVLKILSATVTATGNYTVAPIVSTAPVSIPVAQIPVTITCGYTPVVNVGGVAAEAGLPANVTYGDSGTFTCSTSNPNNPTLLYTKTLVTAAPGKTTSVSTMIPEAGVTPTLEVLTYKAAGEAIALSVQALGAKGYASAIWPAAAGTTPLPNNTLVIGKKSITVIVKPATDGNPLLWTYGDPVPAAETINLGTANANDLAFTTDRLPVGALKPYTVTDASGNSVAPATFAPNGVTPSPAGVYTITPDLTATPALAATASVIALLNNYEIAYTPSLLTLQPNYVATPQTIKPGVATLTFAGVYESSDPNPAHGKSKSMTVTVTNKSGQTLDISGSLTTGTVFAVGPGCAGVAGNGGTCALTVTFAPADTSAQQDTLTINVVNNSGDGFGVPASGYIPTITLKGTGLN